MTDAVRVVLADDHAVLRVGLKTFLEEQRNPPIQVVGEADNGKDAILLAEKLRPQLLILDLSMPEMGGMDAVMEIRRRSIPVKILILTQFTETIYLRRLLEAGANGYILKSARGEELLSAVRSILAGGTYIDPSMAGALLAQKTQDAAGATNQAEAAFAKLTAREKQVLKLIAEGGTNKDIAKTLDLAVKTVMAHRVNLMEKLGIHNRSLLVQFAISVGLISIPEGSAVLPHGEDS